MSQLVGFPGGLALKNLPAVQEMQETWVWSLSQEDPQEKEMATHSSIFAWEIPLQRSLASYNPWGHKESDTTEWLNNNKVARLFNSFNLVHEVSPALCVCVCVCVCTAFIYVENLPK